MAAQTTAHQLYDLLVSRNFDPELLDSAGKPAPDPGETDVFSFDFTSESGKDYGTVVIMLGDDNNLEVYFGDNVGRSMDSNDKTEWYAFLGQLKDFAVKNLMSFSPKNINRLKYAMQSMSSIKEGLYESWVGNRTQSWNGRPTEARLMIKHKKTIGEGDARFRYVESLFVETAEGERYKLPFTKLSGGRAMVEHVRNGGKPYDIRGQHISEMVSELNVLSRFRRANHGKIFEGDTAQLVEQTNAYYKTAQHTLKSLSTRTGYSKYFESWNPNELTEQGVVIESLKHLFVTQTLDQRIEEALPILARIQQQGNAMKEANIFEAWVDQLAEGTWATPDTPEKQQKLVTLMSQEFPVGPDATNATEQLYDLVGDDELFDRLEELSTQDPDADCRQIIYDRMQELSNDPNIAEVMTQFTMDTDTPAEPAEPVQEGQMNAVSQMYDEWMNSEYSPMDDESGDDRAVMQKAVNFLRGQVNPEELESYAELMTRNFHGGIDETVKDPRTQTEDPADTQQPNDTAYQDDLATVLKRAGVDDTVVRAAPDYEAESKPKPDVEEGAVGSALGAVGGSVMGGPVGGIIGSMLGSAIGDAVSSDDEVDETRCNMSESGSECPVHGIAECGIGIQPAMESQKDPMLARIKTLAGFMIK